MERKICLDTNALIEILKNNPKTIELISSLDARFYTTTINIFEGLRGHRKGEKTPDLIKNLDKLDFDEKSATLAAEIDKKLTESGFLLDLRDIFIASICIANDVELLTENTKHFERLKKFGLKLIK